jgi:hypothetical protein
LNIVRHGAEIDCQLLEEFAKETSSQRTSQIAGNGNLK